MMHKAENRILLESGEWHHKIPRSCGGNNSKSNLVKLTYREHFIAHAILTKIMIGTKHRKSMAYAFISMSNRKGVRINSKLFAIIKKQILPNFQGANNNFFGKGYMHIGDKNPFYGKKHDREMIERTKVKLSILLSGDKNPFYGKKHNENTRKKISIKRIIPIEVLFVNGNKKCFYHREELGYFLGISASMGAQLAKPKHVVGSKHHLLEKYGILKINYLNGEDYENCKFEKN